MLVSSNLASFIKSDSSLSEVRRAIRLVEPYFESCEMIRNFIDSIQVGDTLLFFPHVGKNTLIISAINKCQTRSLVDNHPLLNLFVAVKDLETFKSYIPNVFNEITFFRMDDDKCKILFTNDCISNEDAEKVNKTSSSKVQVFKLGYSKISIYDETC